MQHDDPYQVQMRDFVQWLRGGQPPRCSAEDAFEALRISLAALESMQTGALGELLFMRAAGQGTYPAEDWLANAQLAGGGALLERGAPLADLLR
jgi:predicted dehydrogenase